MLSRLAGLACCAASASAQHLVFVGSAGCDGDDHACKEGSATDEQFIRPLMVADNGSMAVIGTEALPLFSIDAGAQPAWITTSPNGCVFATLPGVSKIFSTGPGGSHSVDSGGVNPVFAEPTKDGKVLLVANYHGPDNTNTSTGAFVTSFKIGDKCSLSLADTVPHSGSSVNPQRQGGAHPHSFVPVRGNMAYACDLGMDIIFAYSVSADGKLSELSQTKVAPGSGPRHLVQHPTLDTVYVVTEMGQSLTAYQQSDKGALKLLQTESLFYKDLGPADGSSKAAEIAISPCGKYVYATNRGSQNTVTAFEVNDETGMLHRGGRYDAPDFPRGMSLIADGKILLLAGQRKTEVWSYLVSEGGGLMLADKLAAAVPDPGNPGAAVGLPPHPATLAEAKMPVGAFPAQPAKAVERQLLV